MRRFLLFLLLLIVSVWLGIKIAEDPGYAFFSYRYWSVEMPLWFAVLSFILLMLVLYFTLRFFDSIDLSLYRFKNWLKWRRKNKSYSKTNRGLIELIEANWRAAEYYLLEGVTRSDAPLINFLAAAKAAHQQGAFDRRDNYLRRAHNVAPRAEIPIGLTQAQLQMNQGQLEQALATLKHLYSIAPRQRLVLKLLQELYFLLSDWSALLNILPALRKAKIITTDQSQKLEATCYQELMRSAAHKSFAAVQMIWKQIPKKLQANSEVVATYVQLVAQDDANECEQLINKTLKKNWNPTLVKIYGELNSSDPKKQLVYAESWLKQYGNQPELLLTLGKLCMKCQLWGKARHYFEDSLKFAPSSDTYLQYGKLLEQLGDMNAAMRVYKTSLSS